MTATACGMLSSRCNCILESASRVQLRRQQRLRQSHNSTLSSSTDARRLCSCSASDSRSNAEGAVGSSTAQAISETPTQRRMRESQRVEERVEFIYTKEDWDQRMAAAGDSLVVLEVESQQLCQTGFDEEPELQWKEDREAAQRPCAEIKHVFARTARDSPDVTFLALEADAEEAQPLLDELNIEVLPTVQFWKQGKLLWEHRGIVALQQDLGEGVLYYGDQAADGVRASTFVKELTTRSEYDNFVNSQPANILTVVDVSLRSATPCVRVFPAVMALAKNMQGYASFARLVGDASAESQQVMQELKVLEVPTFLFYRGGKEVSRFTGSSRGDLIGQILQLQNAMGIAPPPVQRPAKKVRQKQQRPKRSAWG